MRQWCQWIDHYAKKRGLPPDLVAAVILQESGGNPNAISKDGAVGLMQVMPSDGLARLKYGLMFAGRPTVQKLLDPEANIAYGTRLLAGHVNRTGNHRDALKSYGPMGCGYYYADIVLSHYRQYGKVEP